MLTAAEALKKSKSGIIEVVEPTIESEGLYRFNNESKVWETKIDSSGWYVSRKWNNWFTHPIFNPYDTIDTELEEAKKLVGTWVKQRAWNVAYKVRDVYRNPNYDGAIGFTNDKGFFVNLSEVEPFPLYPPGRCCLTDPPKEDGYYLVLSKTWNAAISHKYVVDSKKWYDLETPEYTEIKQGMVWYPLPQWSE